MDVLERILKLRQERNWSEYELAARAGLTQSTISSWYKKKMLPTIPSLVRICDAFGVTLSEFFLEERDTGGSSATLTLNSRQIELLFLAARLENEQYEALIRFLKTL